MANKGKAFFTVKSWDEKTWDGQPAQGVDAPKLTLSRVEYTYRGDIEGSSELVYLMDYRADGVTTFLGMEHITGKVGGRSGSFTIHINGSDADGATHGKWHIVPGSGTDELANLRGEGEFKLAGESAEYPTEFTYSFE